MPSSKKSVTERNNTPWSDEDKGRAVAAYAACGTVYGACKITGIPEATILRWSKLEWFNEALHAAEQSKTEEIKSTATRIAVKASQELEDRLQNGDEVLNKDGEVVRKKIGGKDLSIIMAVAIDKRKVLQEQGGGHTNQNSTDKLVHLMEQFIRFANAREIDPMVEERRRLRDEMAKQAEIVNPEDQ